MGNKKDGQLVPYDMVSPGLEAEYTGESDLSLFESNQLLTYSADTEGFVMARYSLWGFAHITEETWNDEIRLINAMQSKLGFLDDNTRRIRQHIGGLVCCDSGVPTTIDELLNIIGTGHLPEQSFRRGCFGTSGTRSTQPDHVESMIVIDAILKGFLNGESEEESIMKYPQAKGFIKRAYEWLESAEKFSELQRLLMRRILLNFDSFTKRNEDIYAVYNNCFAEDGEGFKLEEQISALAGLPKVYPINKKEYQENLNTISDAAKRDLYTICGNIADGGCELSDCHHNTFRFIENWIYGIGTLKWGIPTRAKSTEEKRLGQLLFGYALGINKWLQDIPLQFILLDLGHIDLGFDPKNEILRVYAYLGDKNTPVNKWLTACLWYTLTLNPNASLNTYGERHKELIESVTEHGLSVREWIDSILEGSSNEDNNE